MGESKHTPGPWEVPPNGRNVVGADGTLVCPVPRPTGAGASIRRDANARLIAAAPTMLEALLDAEDFLFNLPGEDAERSGLLEQLRGAISKAGAKVADTSASEGV